MYETGRKSLTRKASCREITFFSRGPQVSDRKWGHGPIAKCYWPFGASCFFMKVKACPMPDRGTLNVQQIAELCSRT